MGTTQHHHHYKTEYIYQTDPQQTRKLEELSAKFNQQTEEIKSLKDPKKIEESQFKLFMSFLTSLATFQQMNPIPKLDCARYVSLVGENSAGKTSAFNWIFGTNGKVGVDDTTDKITLIHQKDKLVYFDTPGLN